MPLTLTLTPASSPPEDEMSPSKCPAAGGASSKLPKWPGEWCQGPLLVGSFIHSFGCSFGPTIIPSFIPPVTPTLRERFTEDLSPVSPCYVSAFSCLQSWENAGGKGG